MPVESIPLKYGEFSSDTAEINSVNHKVQRRQQHMIKAKTCPKLLWKSVYEFIKDEYFDH